MTKSHPHVSSFHDLTQGYCTLFNTSTQLFDTSTQLTELHTAKYSTQSDDHG